MKEMELREHAKCDLCGQFVVASGVPLFYRVSVERFGILLDAVRRQQGLTMMLGGDARLANVMGADEDVAKPMMSKVSVTVCEKCSVNNPWQVAAMAELGLDKLPRMKEVDG